MKKLLLSIATLFVGGLIMAQSTARVQIIHNAPDPAIDTVDVWIGNTRLLDDFGFRTASPFVDAAAGTPLEIRVTSKTATDTTGPLFFTRATFTANDTFIVIARGVTGSGFNPVQPFGLDVFTPALEASGSMMNTSVLVYHGSPDAPTVDVFENSVPAGTVVDDISYGNFAGYLNLATLDYELQVRNENQSAIVAAYQAPLSTLSLGGEAVTVLASGFLDPSQNSNGPAFGLFATTAAGGTLIPLPSASIPEARVQVIHNSADAAAEFVDVWLNDGSAPLIDNFEFRTASPFVNLQAGVQLDISVADSSSTDTTTAIAKFPITLDADSTYIVVANGIVSATGYAPAPAFGLDIFTGARDTALTATNTDVLVYHGSTDAPTVDAYENTVPAGTIVDDISYGQFEGYLQLATADYGLQVRNQNNSAVVAGYDAPLSTLGLGGDAITVLASGFLDPSQNSAGPAFGLFAALPAGGALVALPSASIPEARVQVIHNSADLAAAAVDVWLNDQVLLDNFRFRTASPFVSLQADVDLVVSVADSNSTDTASALAQFTLPLEADSTYIVVANGIVSGTGYTPAPTFGLDIYDQGREQASQTGNTDVLIHHGATDAPAVDVNEISVPAGPLATNLTYSDFAGYLELNTADYTVDVRANSNNALVGVFNAPLNAAGLTDSAITVVASGFADPSVNSNGPAFGLWVAIPAGGPMIQLTNTTSIDELSVKSLTNFSVYPNPVTDQLNIEMDINITEQPEMMIRTLDGRTIKRERISNRFTTLDLEDLSTGMYLIEFRTNSTIESGKLIVK